MKKINTGSQKLATRLLLVSILNFIALSSQADQAQRIETVIQRVSPFWQEQIEKSKILRANPPNTDAKKLWDELDKSVLTTKDGAPPVKLSKPANSDEINLILDWLRWKVLSEKADGRFSYFYAAYLNHLTDTAGNHPLAKEAGIFLIYGRLQLTNDGGWCKDAASLPTYRRTIDSLRFFRPAIESLEKFSKEDQSKLLLQALTIDSVLNRKNIWNDLCNHGPLGAMNAIESAASQSAIQPENGPNATNITIDISHIPPVLVSEAIWKERRSEMLKKQIAFISETWK